MCWCTPYRNNRGRRNKQGGQKQPGVTATGASADETSLPDHDDSAAASEDGFSRIETAMWVGEKGRRLVGAAAAQNGEIQGSDANASADGRPPVRLTFAERRALDMEQQELERGLLLWPDADMVEERNCSRFEQTGRGGCSDGTAGWRKAKSIQRQEA